MRSFWMGLVVLAVLVTGLRVLRSEATGRQVSARAVKAQTEPTPDRKDSLVKGYGVDAAKADEQAVARSQERVRELLRERLDTLWRPNEKVLDPYFLTRTGVIRRVGEPVAVTLKDGDWLVATYQVGLTPDYLQEAARFARHQQMSDRHQIAARVLVGLVALLLVVTSYLRLEEASRGYATTMLRAAAVAALGAVGLGLWLTA